MRLILTLTTQTEISASRSQKGSIFKVRFVPGWRPVDASGLSGSFMSGWNRLLGGRVVLFRVQIKNMWKKVGSVAASGARPWLASGLPGEVLLQRHHLLPALLRRRPLPSLLFTPRCCLTSSCRLLLSWIGVVVVVAAGRQENSVLLIPLGITPEKVCRDTTSAQRLFFVLLGWKITHKTLTFHPLWVALERSSGV